MLTADGPGLAVVTAAPRLGTMALLLLFLNISQVS
jgi:hypothetical protein